MNGKPLIEITLFSGEVVIVMKSGDLYDILADFKPIGTDLTADRVITGLAAALQASENTLSSAYKNMKEVQACLGGVVNSPLKTVKSS